MTSRAVQAALQLEQEILAGRYPKGTKLPPEMELAEILGVSRGTLREAVGHLQTRGFVSRQQGRGTYVTQGGNVHVRMELDLNESVTNNITTGGYSPGTTNLSVTEIEAPAEVRERLAPNARRQRVIEVRRTRTADGVPITHSIDYVMPVTNDLLTLDSDFSGSLYELLHKVHGADVRLGYAKVEAATANPEIAAHLDVEPDHLLLVFKQVHMLSNGEPVMYSAVYHRNDAVDVHVARVNPPSPG